MTDNYLSRASNGIETPSVTKAVVRKIVQSKLLVVRQPQKEFFFFLFLMDSAKFILQSTKD